MGEILFCVFIENTLVIFIDPQLGGGPGPLGPPLPCSLGTRDEQRAHINGTVLQACCVVLLLYFDGNVL